MSMTQFRTIAFLVLAVVTFAAYVVVVLRRADGGPIDEVAYAAPMLWSIGLGIVVAILAEIVARIVWFERRGEVDGDERDAVVDQRGEQAGSAFVAIGGGAAMLMAIAEWDYFWIANTLYAAFAIAGIVACAAKLAFYRWGVPSW
jgi:hypothetical protein